MERYTISILFSLLFFTKVVHSQSGNWIIKDSISIDVNELYIDKLNQIYLLPKDRQGIIKLNEDLTINQEYSSPFISKYVFLDVKDPMKIMVFLPQFANVGLYDESLKNLSDEYFSGFNNESAICFYSSSQVCYFSENRINLRNIQQKQVLTGSPIYYERKTVNDVSQIKSNGRDIFLLLPGLGLWKFNSFLNVDYFIEDYKFRRLEILEDEVYILKDNKICVVDNKSISEKIIYQSTSFAITGFAMNKKYLLISTNGNILRLIRNK